jgi:hypothetical protein
VHIPALFKKIWNFHHKILYISLGVNYLITLKVLPSILIHRSPRFFQFLKKSWKAYFGIAFRALREFSFIRTFKVDFSLGIGKRLQELYPARRVVVE